MVDSPNHDKCRNVTDRLGLLRNHQHAWKNAKWTEVKSFHLPPNIPHTLRVVYKNVICEHVAEQRLSFTQLPSKYTPERHWTLDLGFPGELAAVDVSQDLLVLLRPFEVDPLDHNLRTCYMHLCSLLNGEAHPLSNEPVLSRGPKEYLTVYKCEVYEDYLAVIFDMYSDEGLVIWNWKTGLVEMHLQLEFMCFKPFQFLTDDLIMIADQNSTPSVDGSSYAKHAPQLVIYSISQYNRIQRPLCVLEYPSLIEADRLRLVFLTFLGITSSSPRQMDHTTSSAPVFTNHLNKMIAVSLSLTEANMGITSFILFIPLSSIFSAVQSTAVSSGGTHTIPWRHWGPHGSQLCRIPGPCLRIDTHGLKAVAVFYDKRGSALNKAHLFDLNQLTVCRNAFDTGKPEGEGSSPWVSVVERSISSPYLFLEEVTTYLPGCTVTIPLPPADDPDLGWDSISLSDDTIIVATARSYSILRLSST